jgi:hypothetical protein
MPAPTKRRITLRHDHELDRIVSLEDAAALTSLSPDTIRRTFRSKLVKLSPRRVGLRLRDCLMLDGGEAA